jgi:RNA polymerase sigma-70 factor, ECF subfamily
MTGSDDETLMKSYQAGDLAAFDVLYQRNAGRVYGYLKARLPRAEERDEVFQQIFLKFHRCRERYSSQYSFSQWLFVISNSVLMDYLRSRNRSPSDLATADLSEAETIPSPLSQTEGTPAYEDTGVTEALSGLQPEQRQVVSWRVFDELSYEEIASRLNRSEASVRQIISRALRKLRASVPLKTGHGA